MTVYIYVKSYQLLSLKDMQFVVCQSCLNKAVINVTRQPFIKIIE